MTQDYLFTTVRSAAILTGSYVAGTVLNGGSRGDGSQQYNQLVLYIDFTIGSLTSAEVRIRFSDDNSTFAQETFESISGGTATMSLGEHTMTASGIYRLAIPIKDRYIEIAAKGTGTVTSSSMTINAILGVV